MANLSSRFPGVVATPRPALRPTLSPPRPAPVLPPPAGPGLADRVKAAADLLLAALLLVPALPVMLGCVALVRLTSAGPGVYTQARVGRAGRVFTLYKVRTMYHECESLTGPRWCMPGDPRITPVGWWLRKLHLDELPQLFNVLRGDMSLVGPRPERPEIVKSLRQTVVGYDRRHAVKPGITGWAQVHLPPDTCIRSVKNKLAYDLFYIRRRSAVLELVVLFFTGLKLLGLKRAYQRKPRFPTEE